MMHVATRLVTSHRMRLSGTVMEIWRLKDNEVTILTFLRVVHCDHASILHRYRDIAI